MQTSHWLRSCVPLRSGSVCPRAQVAIAWVYAQADARETSIVPIIGARRRDRLAESLGALKVSLSADDLAEIERAIPPDAAAGARYAEAQLAHMDSEKG